MKVPKIPYRLSLGGTFLSLFLSVPLSSAQLDNTAESPSWTMIETAPLESPGSGSSRILLSQSQSPLEFSEDPELFVGQFLQWLQVTSPARLLRQPKPVRLIRILNDEEGPLFTRDQKNRLAQSSKAFGVTLRFETVNLEREKKETADAAQLEDLRQKAESDLETDLQQKQTDIIQQEGLDRWEKQKDAARAEIEKSIIEEYFSDVHASDLEKQTVLKGLRDFFGSIYETPKKDDAITGTAKGAIVAAFTLFSWNHLGVPFKNPLAWFVGAKLVGQEIIFGPYLQTYLNFLKRKIEKIGGAPGVALWGWGQGFVQFAIDTEILHQLKPDVFLSAYDPKFLVTFVNLGAVGTFLGGTMPAGINRMVEKGYIPASWGVRIMQSLDLFMPLEGLLMTLGSHILFPIFLTHQTLKLGIYALGTALPTQPMMTVMPNRVLRSGRARSIYQFTSMPDFGVGWQHDATLAFLESESYPSSLKAEVLGYVLKEYSKIPFYATKAQSGFVATAQLYAQYIAENSSRILNAQGLIDKKVTQLKAVMSGDFADKIEYSGSGLSPYALAANERKKLRAEVFQIYTDYKNYKRMANLILDAMPSQFTQWHSKLIALRYSETPKIPAKAYFGNGVILGVGRLSWVYCNRILSR